MAEKGQENKNKMKRIYKLVLDVYAVHAEDLVENHNLEVKNPYLHLARPATLSTLCSFCHNK